MRAVVTLTVKVVPGSSRDCLAGWLGEALKVRVVAPAERSKANRAVERAIAEALGVSTETVRIVKGRASPRKLVQISDLPESEVRHRLADVIRNR